jgi:hypothetical protein
MAKYHLTVVRVEHSSEEMLTEYDPLGNVEADSLEEAARQFAAEFRIMQDEDGEEDYAVVMQDGEEYCETFDQYSYSFIVEPCLEEDKCNLLENPVTAIPEFVQKMAEDAEEERFQEDNERWIRENARDYDPGSIW